MKKIVITESQYKRVFLDEQDTGVLNPYSQYSITNTMNRQNPYEKAQQQWKYLGAPDPKTGHKLIPQEYIDMLYDTAKPLSDIKDIEIQKNYDADESGKYQQSLIDIHNSVGLDSNHPSKIIPYQHNLKLKSTENKASQLSSEQRVIWSEYSAAKAWNDLINNQKTLIPQWCKKETNWKWVHTSMKYIDKSNASIKKQCSSSFNQYKRYKGSNFKMNGKYYKWENEDEWFCKYRVDVGKSAMNYCNNSTEKGPFVYKNDKVRGGHICMCINLEDAPKEIMYQSGHGYKFFSKEEQLNLVNRHKEWMKDQEPGFWESVLNTPNIIMDCVSDYHCWLDIASIAALAIPGWGLIISAGLDAANSGAYFIEAMNSDNPAEANMLYAAGTMTAMGAIPGVGKAVRVAKGGNKVTQKVMKELTTDYAKLIKNTAGKPSVKQLDDILSKSIANKSLKESDKLVIQNFYKALGQGSKETKSFLMGFDKFKRLHKVEFEKFLKNPPKEFTNILKLSKGNVVEALWKWRKGLSKSDAILQAKWFIALYAVLPPSIQVYQEREEHKKKSGAYGPKDMVNTEYSGAWDLIKQIFMSDGSRTDNLLFTKAWNAGWRPNIKIVDNQWVADDNQPIVPEMYQTKTMKKVFSDYLKLMQSKVVSGGDYHEVLDMEGGEFSLEGLDIDIDMD